MNHRHAQDAIRQLSEQYTELTHKLPSYSAGRQADSDYDTDHNSPIFDMFCDNGGVDAIAKMINFTPKEFAQSMRFSKKRYITTGILVVVRSISKNLLMCCF